MKLKKIILATLLASTFQSALAGENLLKNGGFANNNLKPWKLFATEKVTKPTARVEDGVATITTTQVSEKPSNEQLSQQVIGIKSDTQYKISFDAKSEDITADLLVSLARSKDWNKGHYGAHKTIKLTKEWKQYTINFTSIQIEKDNHPQMKFLFGLMKGHLSLRKIKLIELPKKDA